jgi:hypothetical protein
MIRNRMCWKPLIYTEFFSTFHLLFSSVRNCSRWPFMRIYIRSVLKPNEIFTIRSDSDPKFRRRPPGPMLENSKQNLSPRLKVVLSVIVWTLSFFVFVTCKGPAFVRFEVGRGWIPFGGWSLTLLQNASLSGNLVNGSNLYSGISGHVIITTGQGRSVMRFDVRPGSIDFFVFLLRSVPYRCSSYSTSHRSRLLTLTSKLGCILPASSRF